MIRAIILPIFRSTRLCVTACGIMHRPATSWVHCTTSCNTRSSAPEDGQNNCPKHVELTGIINKPLLLHLVRCLYYLYQWCTVKQILNNEIYLLIKYIKSFLWRVAKGLSFIEDARCLKVKSCLVVRIKLLISVNIWVNSNIFKVHTLFYAKGFMSWCEVILYSWFLQNEVYLATSFSSISLNGAWQRKEKKAFLVFGLARRLRTRRRSFLPRVWTPPTSSAWPCERISGEDCPGI